MVISMAQTQNLTLHLLVEKTKDGRSKASVLELPDCVVEAATEEQAIELLQQSVSDRLAETQVKTFEISIEARTERENPWLEFIGMYEGDADFAEIAAELRLERDFDETELIE